MPIIIGGSSAPVGTVMSNTAAGPASGTPVVVIQVSGGIEVQVPNGLPSLPPSAAPFVDIQGATSVVASPVKGTFAGVQFAIPA